MRHRKETVEKSMFQSVFEDRGNWYKGNLHMHTTRSDGHLDPAAAVERYRQHGYDFVALTDHRKPSATERMGDVLVLSGVEWDTGGANTKSFGDVPTYHILGIGMTSDNVLDYRSQPHPEPQAIVDFIQENNGIAILAHPAWSVMDPAGIGRLKGITAAEIYNSVSDLPFNGERADSSAWFDIWATNYNRLIPAVASDDAHAYEGDECYAYTMVNAAELSRDAVIDALQSGNFYASQRPVLHEMAIDWDNGIVHMEFSQDVTTVVFYSNHIWVPERVTLVKNGSMDYHIAPGEFYVRAELIARDGRKAWTSPVRVD